MYIFVAWPNTSIRELMFCIALVLVWLFMAFVFACIQLIIICIIFYKSGYGRLLSPIVFL